MARVVTATLLLIAALALVHTASGQALDSTFGGDGYAVLAREGFPLDLTDAAPDASGRVYVAINDGVASGGTAFIGRVRADGALDAAFGGGLVAVDREGPRETIRRLAVRPEGGVAAAGSAYTIGPSSLQQSALLATIDGDGGGARSWAYLYGDRTEATGVALVGGGFALSLSIQDGSDDRCAVLRVDADGVPVPTFGTGGLATLPFPGPCQTAGVVASGDGVVVGGTRTEGDSDVFLARYRSDGTLDPDFALGGVDARGFDDADEFATDLSTGPDGDLLLAGAGEKAGVVGLVLLRLDADGTPDDLGDNGFIYATEPTSSFTIGAGPVSTLRPSAAIDAEGRVTVATTTREPLRLTLVRFLPDGLLDTSFGEVGFARLDVPDAADGVTFGTAIGTDASGRTVFAGTVKTVSNGDRPLIGRLQGPGGTPTEPGPEDPPLALEVWPNPTRGAASFTPEASGVVTVHDALGREVYRADAVAGQRVALPTDKMPASVYLVTVESDDERRTAHLTVVR